ncbi:acid phosphatase type 7-like [Tubulanus polymorphus]|uniref:acid phosphatase type 7-like n=1 Tax=Tubulanus polymorphus TaxID=672921 RepID=UPI003DA2CD77
MEMLKAVFVVCCFVALNFWILTDAAAKNNITDAKNKPSGNQTQTSGNQSKTSQQSSGNQSKTTQSPANKPQPGVPIPSVNPAPQPVESAREGVHLSLGPDPFLDRVIMWTYDKKQDTITIKSANPNEFTRTDTVDGQLMNNTYAKHWIMRYEIQSLKEDQKYTYEIGGKQFSFHTWDHHNSIWPEEFLLYGGHINKTSIDAIQIDWNHEHRLKHETELNRYYGMLNLGDWSCSLNPKDYLNYLQDFASQIPFLTCPGEKDMRNKFNHYKQIFSQHGVPYGSDQYWYSFDTDYAHFISLTTEMYFMDGKDMILAEQLAKSQYDWLEKDLKKVNKAYEYDGQRPWVIVFSHRPIYCSGDRTCIKESETLHIITDLFHEYSVDLVITAQDNFYERTFPVSNKKKIGDHYKNPKATVYVTTSAFSCNKPDSKTVRAAVVKPEWSDVVKRISEITYGRLMIHNKTHLFFEERIAKNHTTVDKFWMQQHHRNPFPPTPKINSWIVVLIVGILITVVSVVVLFMKRKAIAEYITMRKTRKSQTYVNLPEGSFDL